MIFQAETISTSPTVMANIDDLGVIESHMAEQKHPPPTLHEEI